MMYLWEWCCRYSLIFQDMGLGVRTYLHTYGQSRDNQNFLDRWVTKFSKLRSRAFGAQKFCYKIKLLYLHLEIMEHLA